MALGKPWHYALAVGLALFLWLVPVVVENSIELRSRLNAQGWNPILTTFLTSFAVTLLPAFGEEFSWRGYLLPRLLKRYTPRRALLGHGFITWLWHVPVIVTMALDMDLSAAVAVPLVLAISLVPAVMHAVVFARLWSMSGSLLVTTVYHASFDEVRDTLAGTVGLGLLAEPWQAVMLTLLGTLRVWKAPRDSAHRLNGM